jgi:hypothetical protein
VLQTSAPRRDSLYVINCEDLECGEPESERGELPDDLAASRRAERRAGRCCTWISIPRM